MPDAAVSGEGLFIPLIDFSCFTSGSPAERADTAKAILRGFQDAGFIYLKNHPIPATTLKHVFSLSAQFFDQPASAKMELCWTTPEANRGYSAPGREKVSQSADIQDVEKMRMAAPDLKESFEIGREGVQDHPNQWPSVNDADDVGKMAAFKPDMLCFFDQCQSVHVEVMRAIAIGMGLDDGFFDTLLNVGDNTLRLLHYPKVEADVFKINPGQVRAGEHSDYGSITLLFQDDRGGLQVRSPSGHFVDATPIKDTIVVNAGDLLARWSNDTIKSTVHRVVEPPRKENKVYPPRYSIAYFCNPNFKDFIEVLPGTYTSEKDKKYEGINSGQYLVQRLTATY